MTQPQPDSTEILSRALDQTADVLARIEPDDLAGPTPCTEWDVAHLIAHVIADPGNFVLMAAGKEPDWSVQPIDPDSDWVAAFRTAADDLMASWSEASEDAKAGMDWQTGEIAVHTWDLARATGQSIELDADVGQRGFDFMSTALTPDNRGDAFGPERPAGPDASVYDRLAAFAGRDPSWQRP